MNKIAYNLPKTDAELVKLQDSAIRASNSARTKIQLALVATVYHLSQHHDVRVARRLVDGLHETVRGKAIVDYLTKFGHMIVGELEEVQPDGKIKTIKTFTRIKGEADEHQQSIRESFDKAKETMWWSLKKEDAFYTFDLAERVKKLSADIKRANAKLADGKGEGVSMDVSDKAIRELLALCNFEAIIEPANDSPASAEQAA